MIYFAFLARLVYITVDVLILIFQWTVGKDVDHHYFTLPLTPTQEH